MDATPDGMRQADGGTPPAQRHVLVRRASLFLSILRDAVPARFALAASVFALLAGLTEGVGLALLAPLVGLVAQGSGTSSGFGAAVTRAFGAIGLPLSLGSLLAVFVGLVVARAAIVTARDVAVVRLRNDFVETLRQRLYDALSRARWTFVARERLSNLTKSLTSDVDRAGTTAYAFLQMPGALIVALIQVAVAVSFEPVLSVAVLTVGVALAVVVRLRRGNVYKAGQKLVAANRASFQEISDFLAALKLTKAHNAEERQRRAFLAAIDRQREEAIAFGRRSAEARLLMQIGVALALGAFVYVGAAQIGIGAPHLVVMIVVFARLMPMVTQMQQNLQQIAYGLPVFDDLLRLVERAETAREAVPQEGGARLPLERDIRFEAVRFRYDESAGRAALDGVDLAIPAGSFTAVVGPSGAGKSTLVDLMLGLIVPESGRLTVDGAALTGDRLAAWRRSVAYVPQDNFLFNDTVRANLVWGRPEASDAEIGDALALTGADAVISRMAEGLATTVGERGNRLSGGERQRLALARALIRRPTLLILDEATNALDAESERAVWSAVEKLHGRITVVVIAHRLSSVRQADRIVVIDGGRIVQAGRWEELAADSTGRFAGLIAADGASEPFIVSRPQ